MQLLSSDVPFKFAEDWGTKGEEWEKNSHRVIILILRGDLFSLFLLSSLSPRPIIVTLRPWLGRGYDDDDEEMEKEKEKGDDDLLSRRGS